jgi:FlaA1/EpsC-like NDP-sugar epimerase
MARKAADWAKFLGRPAVAADPRLAESVCRGKSVLITGAGGSLGSGLARAVAAASPRTLVLLDLSEGGLYDCHRYLRSSAAAEGFELAQVVVAPMVGSVGDELLLKSILREHAVEVVLHTAAYKHVPLMEQNPLAAIGNNSIGTQRLVTAAREASVGQLTMISTDKAVHPRSIMGVSKRIAELAVLSQSTDTCRMNAIRLGNVLGSSGSVAPIFQEELESGLPLTVASPEATRYFLTPGEAEAAILRAAASSVTGKLLIAECGAPRRVVDLARFMAASFDSTVPARIEYVGLRPGDKLSEELVSEDETVLAERVSGMRVVDGSTLDRSEVIAALERLGRAVARHDLDEVFVAIRDLVPSYRPALRKGRGNFPAEAL